MFHGTPCTWFRATANYVSLLFFNTKLLSPSSISIVNFFSLHIHCKTVTKKVRGFDNKSNFVVGYNYKLCEVHTQFRPDRFSHFDVYWIQTPKQTSKVYLQKPLDLEDCTKKQKT